MKLDKKLVQLRKEKGLTQLELAEAVRVSRQAVSKWESGGSLPSTEKLKSLSELYGVPIDYLLSEREEIETECDNKTQEESKKRKSSFLKWLVIALVFLMLAGYYTLFFVNKGAHSNDILMETMNGEVVVEEKKNGFSLEW